MSTINSSTEFDGEFSRKKIIEKDNFTWTIEKFSLDELKTDEEMRSPVFDSKNNNRVKWSLFMSPEQVCSDKEDYISLCLELEDFECVELTVLCCFYVLRVDGEKKHKKVKSIQKLNNTADICFCNEFLKRDLLRSDDNELLSNGNLIVGCEIFYYCGPINTVTFLTGNNVNESLNLLMNDIAGMLESSKFSDCVIKVGNSKINVHKCILVSRSQVFDSMLTDKQSESNPNIIEINGFRLEVVKEMINYLYSGKSPNIDKMACEMLEIGEKYNLKRLKLMAEESLLYSMSVENVCDYLACSELYSGEILKGFCMRFIYLNAENVVNTEKWKKVVIDHPLLIANIFNIAVNIE
uniref:Speckle-type POZ protein (inferred by orthology to a human protein) n=1 Tax=Strongyloides papillosus TaxID=174720 RepID=A0A0N5BT33_STREA